MRRYYQILGVSPSATSAEIREAWLFSLKAFHPDKFAGSSQKQQSVAQERTKAINEAYEVLSNPNQRAAYDYQSFRAAHTESRPEPKPEPKPEQRQEPKPTTPKPATSPAGKTVAAKLAKRWWFVAASIAILLATSAGVIELRNAAQTLAQSDGVRRKGTVLETAAKQSPPKLTLSAAPPTVATISKSPTTAGEFGPTTASPVEEQWSKNDRTVDNSSEWLRRIKEETAQGSRALQQGNYETIVDQTYPKLVELLGGRDQVLAEMKAAMKEIQAKGVKVVAVNVGEPSGPILSSGKLFSLVPTSTTMTVAEARITQKSFMLAISTDNGITWTFIDGSAITTAMLSMLFPDLPPELKLPANEAPIIASNAAERQPARRQPEIPKPTAALKNSPRPSNRETGGKLPYGIPTRRSGIIISPYTPNVYFDASGVPANTPVHDPYANKNFLVPWGTAGWAPGR